MVKDKIYTIFTLVLFVISVIIYIKYNTLYGAFGFAIIFLLLFFKKQIYSVLRNFGI